MGEFDHRCHQRDRFLALSGPVDEALVDLERVEPEAVALDRMTGAAKGSDSTKDMVSRIDRSSRLAERSRGVLDARATSSCVLLTRLAETARRFMG